MSPLQCSGHVWRNGPLTRRRGRSFYEREVQIFSQVHGLSRAMNGCHKHLRELVLWGGLAFFLSACAGSPPPEPPAPRSLEVGAAPDSAISAAAGILRSAGWTVQPAEESAAALAAEHEGRGDENGQWMTCETGVGRTGDRRRATRELQSKVSVRIRAEPAERGSVVHILGGIAEAWSRMPFNDPRSVFTFVRSRCVSSGAIEALLADSLKSRFSLVGNAGKS
jgi:hypothetical protein